MASWLSSNGDEPMDRNYVRNVLNYINDLKESFSEEEFKCLERKHQDLQARLEERHQHQAINGGIEEGGATEGQEGCEVSWDSLLCWPYTSPGTLAILPCFEELNGIRYDNTQNASRWCWLNGTWDSYSNYSSCRDIRPLNIEADVEITTKIYFIGYSLSLCTLAIAVSIFLYFKELRCLRNNIHINLMFTYILADLMWILTTAMQVSMQTDIPTCVTFFSLLHYFQLTNFFWMFVEGLYLYLLVVRTFTGDNIQLKMCLVIGWGVPILIIAIWGIAKSLVTQGNQNVALWKHCPWMTPHSYDWIYQASVITVLAVNVIFLFLIMWVLITKLWSANNAETQQYRKASKALLVLIPLLGVTYVLVLAGPTEGQAANAFSYTRAVLLSSQGLLVTLFYCFLNTEVQNTLRHHFARWTTSRDLGNSRRYYKNWSPRSRTESIRLYGQPSNPYRKRESTVSETTTTTVIGPNSTTTFLDKSKKAISEDSNE
uniref:diuretic hormone receptor-like isoform X1 n=1 Tax=Vespula vulgaris TaxID=7454 RepID=UPI00213ADFD2|nr:diuretic hormone receptor-like isoform X1 [Vespula vulgaris]